MTQIDLELKTLARQALKKYLSEKKISNESPIQGAMTEVKITQLPNNEFAVWYNGENIRLNKDINIETVIKFLNSCIKYLYAYLREQL